MPVWLALLIGSTVGALIGLGLGYWLGRSSTPDDVYVSRKP
jgi:membrane protein DedA with SNARE-associated domain